MAVKGEKRPATQLVESIERILAENSGPDVVASRRLVLTWRGLAKKIDGRRATDGSRANKQRDRRIKRPSTMRSR